ncbi:hypothetical protein OY671_004896 [Metschnikowia pulcherrima]|nr:hypothetical protein OY671_004896 [Metschnikowia pulcherrima]
MSKPAGLFKARKLGTDSDVQQTQQSFLADSTTETGSASLAASPSTGGATELTKNDKYCVSRLPALPPVLSNDPGVGQAGFLNGYTDNATRCALAVSDSAINVWPYASIDDTPITFEFPLPQGAGIEAMPLAILTRPTPGTTLDPGLCIVHSTTGLVTFYESVQYAPALGMINSSRIETHIGISAAQGEYITLAENVEPAGIAVATSWKRVVLIVLRDYKGAAQLQTLELTKPPSRLFSGWLGGSREELDGEIVSIKVGQVSQHGSMQDIIVQDASGTFKKFQYQLSASGTPYIGRHVLSYKLSSFLEKNIDGLIPGSVLHTQFLDLWPLVADQAASPDVYVSLVAVSSSAYGIEQHRLLLLRLKINDSGVLVLSSHQLPDVGSNQLASRPRLFIPSPEKTAFVSIGNAVILSDLSVVSSRHSTSNFQYYEPKWEDVVHFKSAVQIIGFGYEDQTAAANNPALVFISAEHGVVRIERFIENSTEVTSDDTDPSDPVALLKSHISQAIFYGDSSFVEFNVDASHSLDIVNPALTAVVSEVLDSTSPYLPPNFSSTRDSFSLRLKLLKALIDYARANFADHLYVLLPVIVEALEKLEVASNVWHIADGDGADAGHVKHVLKTVIKRNDMVHGYASKDILRSFFSHNVSEILIVLTELVDDLSATPESTIVLLQLLVRTLHDAVYKNEVAYIFGTSEIPPYKLWVFESSLVVKAEEVFTQAFCTKSNSSIQDSLLSRPELVQLTDSLFFIVNSAILFMQQTNDDQLHEYVKWYNRRKSDWTDALLTRGLSKEALAIAQKYHDFDSIAYVLEKEREQASPEYIFDKIDFFMNQYGYDFASKLFDFYLSHDQLQRILVDCKPYGTFLEQYFAEKPRKSNKVSWIYYLQAREFKKASNVLISLSAEKDHENQEIQEFNYSMAKLAAIAAKAEGPSSPEESSVLDEIAVEAESNLLVVRIQNKIYQTIASFVGDKQELVTLDYFVNDLSNPKLRKFGLKAEVGVYFDRFAQQKALSKEHLVSLLTSLNPTTQFDHVFADALKVAASITNDAFFHNIASEIWKKLICVTDDWHLISATENNSDDVNKMRLRDTIFFRTVRSVQGSDEIMKVLDDVLEKAREDGMTDGDIWGDQLKQLAEECDIELWINTVRNEAK